MPKADPAITAKLARAAGERAARRNEDHYWADQNVPRTIFRGYSTSDPEAIQKALDESEGVEVIDRFDGEVRYRVDQYAAISLLPDGRLVEIVIVDSPDFLDDPPSDAREVLSPLGVPVAQGGEHTLYIPSYRVIGPNADSLERLLPHSP